MRCYQQAAQPYVMAQNYGYNAGPQGGFGYGIIAIAVLILIALGVIF